MSVQRRAAIFGLIMLTAIAGCGSSGAQEKADSPPGFPVTVDNCGERVTVDAPPKRAVSLNQGSTEILLSLGLADRMVGTATWTDPVRENLEAANEEVPRIADDAPSFERVLETEPDFVSASFASVLGDGGVATREDFNELSVPAYLSPAECAKTDTAPGDGQRQRPLRMQTIYQEIDQLATVFDVTGRGAELVTDLKQRMRTVRSGEDASNVTLMYWFANRESPYLAGCCGAPGIITRAVGAENVFDDSRQEWPQVGWETVLERDPDVLVLGDLTRRSQTAESAEQKIAFLESDPVASRLTAVREQRYVIVNGADLNPSIRTVDGAEKVKRGLRDLGFIG